MGEKVIFLDIDGPMIPATMMLIDRRASWKRLFPQTTIATLNAICERTGAKVVFNTTHNTPIPDVADIEIAIVRAGLLSEYLHPTDLKTHYPAKRRDEAVKDWLSRHPETKKWVALDDVKFTDEENLILIDPDAGLHVGHANAAIEQLDGRAIVILI